MNYLAFFNNRKSNNYFSSYIDKEVVVILEKRSPNWVCFCVKSLYLLWSFSYVLTVSSIGEIILDKTLPDKVKRKEIYEKQDYKGASIKNGETVLTQTKLWKSPICSFFHQIHTSVQFFHSQKVQKNCASLAFI